MSKLSLWRTISLVCVFCAVAAIGSPAQTFTTLLNFDFTNNGATPRAGLIQATDGNFYGTVSEGANVVDPECTQFGCGTLFKMTPGGTLTTLHSFDGNDGASPYGGLVQATDGNFYGTTFTGPRVNTGPCAPFGCGTVFKITPGGTLTILHSFDSTDGRSLAPG